MPPSLSSSKYAKNIKHRNIMFIHAFLSLYLALSLRICYIVHMGMTASSPMLQTLVCEPLLPATAGGI